MNLTRLPRTFGVGVPALATLLLAASLAAAAVEPVVLRLPADFVLTPPERLPHPAPPAGMQFTRRAYEGHNAVEWQVRLRGAADGGPLYEGVKSADFVVQFPQAGAVDLHWNNGSRAETQDFQPHQQTLAVGQPFALESSGGRSSDGALPYFNLATPGGGLIVAVGWSGDWQASFEVMPGNRVRVTAGLKGSRFRLSPGEEVRLPSLLLMGYRGDWLDGQNRFRRLMLRHFTPASHPPLALMPVAASVHGMIGFNDTTETNLVALARDLAALRLPLDTFWLDAGWNEGGFPRGQGNPHPDPQRLPRGLVPVGDAARAAGLRFLTWFEPERAMRGTWLDRGHPDWLLSPAGCPEELRYQERDGFRLLDLGRADARSWAVETISAQLRDAQIGIYRQDFNLYPAYFWAAGEPADAAGVREVRYVTGLYAFLDALAQRNPGLILDNCASGGRRLDFEMMRRCVALWRSDSCWDSKEYPRNVQAMTHGLSLWLPLHGLGAAGVDEPALRSGMGACASFAINFRDPAAVAALRRHLDRYLPLRPLFTRDYHPLTPWSDKPARRLAFEFHDPDTGQGLVQVFEDGSSAGGQPPVRLRGLDPDAAYTITDWDAPGIESVSSGAELMDQGLPIPPGRKAPAMVFVFQRNPGRPAPPR